MEKKYVFIKGIVLGIIILFVGACFVPSISSHEHGFDNTLYADDSGETGHIRIQSGSMPSTPYSANGLGLILVFGHAAINKVTGDYNLSLQNGRFQYIGFAGGGPSLLYTYPHYLGTYGQYTAASFTGFCLNPFADFYILIGILLPGGTIAGSVYT